MTQEEYDNLNLSTSKPRINYKGTEYPIRELQSAEGLVGVQIYKTCNLNYIRFENCELLKDDKKIKTEQTSSIEFNNGQSVKIDTDSYGRVTRVTLTTQGS